MAEVHHYNLERILEDLQIEATESDTVGKQLIDMALESEGEVLDEVAASDIATPSAVDARLTNIVNIRTRGKWIQRTDTDRGQKLIDRSDKLLGRWVAKQTSGQDICLKTAGNVDN